MNSVKILHTADLHIGAKEAHLEAAAAQRRNETLLTFEGMVRKAEECEVSLFLIAGDAFDYNTVEEGLVKGFFRCVEAAKGISFVYAAGNHDPLSAESPFNRFKLPQNLHILPPADGCIFFENLGVRVYGASFNSTYKSGTERFSVTPPQDDIINIMCIHGDLKADGGSNYNPISEAFIAESGMDYIALGHKHTRTDIMRTGSTLYAYCGCPEGHGFDETGEKGVFIGEVSRGDARLQFVPTARRMYICEEIDVTDTADIANRLLFTLKEKYGNSYRENLYKLVLVGTLPEGQKIDLAEAAARISAEVYFAKLYDRTQTEIDFEQLALEQSLKGVFTKNMLARINAAPAEEKEGLTAALRLGLKAFDSEVNFQ